MNTKSSLCLLLALAAFWPGCTFTPKVHTKPRAGVDYSRYRTFGLMPLPATGPASDPGLMLRLAEPARQAVVEALTAKGFTETDRADADFAVNLRGESLPKVEVTDWGYNRTTYSRYGEPIPVHVGRVETRTYEERTLIVEVFDNRTKELVWVGWSKRKTTRPIKVENVQNGIRNILAEFPPASTAHTITK